MPRVRWRLRWHRWRYLIGDSAWLFGGTIADNIAYGKAGASRDDVEHGKPDPEIYCLVANVLGVPPEECLVIEDSPTGVKAGLAAGMDVVAVSTPFTRQRLHESGLLPPGHIVDDPSALPGIVAHVVAHHD